MRINLAKKIGKNIRISNEILIQTTAHLFETRKGDTRHRAYIFKRDWQIIETINYAIENKDLLSFLDKGKVAITFNCIEDVFTMLVNVESYNPNYKYQITIITIEKQHTRHTTRVETYNSVKVNKIYMMDYYLTRTFASSHLECLSTLVSNGEKIYIFINKAVENKANFQNRERALLEGAFSSLHSKLNNKCTNKGAFWFKMEINNEEFYLRAAIEKNHKESATAYIILNIEASLDVVERKSALNNTPISEFKGVGNFKKTVIERKGLRIIKNSTK